MSYDNYSTLMRTTSLRSLRIHLPRCRPNGGILTSKHLTMRLRPDFSSPWRQRVWIEAAEFEVLMDDLRRRAGEERHIAGEGIDVDRVIELGLETVVDYCLLPNAILGRTWFFADGSVRIEISRDLADRAEMDRVERRRLRSTMAHECGHVACHRCLHLKDTETLSLFSDTALPAVQDHPPIMCREEAVRIRYSGEWWEYQANQCMTTLLLPKQLFKDSVQAACEQNAAPTFEDALRRERAQLIVSDLADEYDVSLTMVLYRLQSLGFVPDSEQRRLRLLDPEAEHS